MAELPSFSPPASKNTIEYRTSPLREARMRPKLKAAPVYILWIAIISLWWHQFYVIPMLLPSSYHVHRFSVVFKHMKYQP